MNWASELILAASLATDGQQLTNCHWLPSHVCDWQESRIESTRREEVGLNATWVACRQVAIRVGSQCWNGIGLDEVAAELEEGHEATILGEAGQSDAVRDGWVHGGERIGVL